MNEQSLYRDLDTSFVDLSALMRHLRERRFEGLIRVRLGGYRGEIELGPGDRVEVREHDATRGRTSAGEEALRRLLIRAREPGGSIDVLGRTEERSGPADVPEPAAMPFELTNEMEERARRTRLPESEWRDLLRLSVELLGVVDRALARGGLDFAAVFRRARAGLAADYPFLNPEKKRFEYAAGRIRVTGRVPSVIFVGGLTAGLEKVLERLERDPRHAATHRRAAQEVIALLHRRRERCDRFGLTAPLERMLGI